jgi:hypothetical protein
MSDYFDHLAAIALGTAPSLAPRPAARFEPAAMVEIDPFAEHDDAAQPRAGAMEAPPDAVTAAPAESPRPPRAPTPPEFPAGRVETPSPDPSPAVPGNRAQTATPAAERTVVRAEVVASGIVPHAEAPPEPPAAARASARRAVRQVPPAPRHPNESPQEAPPPAEPASTMPGNQVGLDQATSFEASPGPPADVGHGPETSPRAVTLERPSGRAAYIERPVQGTRAETRQGAPLPTTIQVTIGRVEVRAVQPPAPAPSPRPVAKPPALTLDDYLAARDGGSS